MPPLKKKNLLSLSQEGAASLPSFMTELGTTMDVYLLELQKLVPAPPDWNFYRPLSDNKMIELIESIEQNGLLHPIVVWEPTGYDDTMSSYCEPGQYIILSGHNRVNAYRRLFEQTGLSKYARIACCIRRDLDAAHAREVIIDSNWVQRSLSTSERTRSICEKYALSGRKTRAKTPDERGRTYDIIAKQYGLSGRQIHRYLKLGQLHPGLLSLVDAGKLSFTSGVALSDFPEETQRTLVLEFAPLLTTKSVSQLRPDMKKAELRAALTEKTKAPKTVPVSVDVPASQKAAFLAMAEAWLLSNPPDEK